MSRFGYTESFFSARSGQECLQAAADALSSLGCRPAPAADGTEVSGSMGKGWAIRLLGAVIAPVEWFPVRLSIGVRDTGKQREVTLRVDENFGPGSLVGVEKKIRAHCDGLGGRLSRLLKDRLG